MDPDLSEGERGRRREGRRERRRRGEGVGVRVSEKGGMLGQEEGVVR